MMFSYEFRANVTWLHLQHDYFLLPLELCRKWHKNSVALFVMLWTYEHQKRLPGCFLSKAIVLLHLSQCDTARDASVSLSWRERNKRQCVTFFRKSKIPWSQDFTSVFTSLRVYKCAGPPAPPQPFRHRHTLFLSSFHMLTYTWTGNTMHDCWHGSIHSPQVQDMDSSFIDCLLL